MLVLNATAAKGNKRKTLSGVMDKDVADMICSYAGDQAFHEGNARATILVN